MKGTRARPTTVIRALTTVGLVVGIAGCGGTGAVPSNSVAMVAGTPIKVGTFKRWLAVTAGEYTQALPGVPVAVPDPPSYRGCVATLAELAAPAAGNGKPSVATLRMRCQQRYAQLKPIVIGFLIRNQWLSDEARSLGVVATPTGVRNELNVDMKQSYPSRAAFTRFLRQTGVTTNELVLLARRNVLTRKVEAALGGQQGISEAEVVAYYDHNRSAMVAPERRGVEFVMAGTEADGLRARDVVQSGMDWRAVAKKYSIARNWTAQITRSGSGAAAFVRAIFATRKGQVRGPITTPHGYLVFAVTSAVPAHPLTLKQAHNAIVNTLSNQRALSLNRRIAAYQAKYLARTECAKDFLVAGYCANAPKPKASKN